MSELKKCPFCGAPEPFMRERYVKGTANRKHYRRECRVCHATFANWYRRKAKADEAWNRRAQPENEPIVRCGECIHFEPYDGEEHKGDCNELVGLDSCMYEDDYCSYGEQKPERSEG